MKQPRLYDPVRYLRDKGVTVRKGFPDRGEDVVRLEFEKNRKWTPKEVTQVMHIVKQSRKLIELQLTVPHNMPPRSVESLMAKDLIRIVTGKDGKRRYVITPRGKCLLAP